MPSIPVPTLKSINSIPKLKDRSCDFFGRITCNLFQPLFPQRDASQSRNTPEHGNVLERRTVDSRQISTISSLVDRDNRSGSLQLHDSQKENFGLYALKHNRSSASKSGSFQSQKSGSRSTVENQNHELFQPCRATSLDSASSQGTVILDEGGYYEINLSEDESGSEKMNRIKTPKIKPNLRSDPMNNAERGVKSAVSTKQPKIVPPVPPKRTKSKSRQKQPQPQPQTLFVPSEKSNVAKPLVERSLHSQRTKVMAEKHQNPTDTINKNEHVKDSIPVRNEKIVKTGSQFEQINVSKNKSELFRIANTNPRMIASAPNETYPSPTPAVRQIETSRRKLQRQSRSSAKSVDIFDSTNPSNAFHDFEEVLKIAPVVAVDRDLVSNGNGNDNQNHNHSLPKRSSRVTIKNMETYRRSSSGTGSNFNSSRDSNGNAENDKTWNISADSNEITVYARNKVQEDLDEEIIVWI